MGSFTGAIANQAIVGADAGEVNETHSTPEAGKSGTLRSQFGSCLRREPARLKPSAAQGRGHKLHSGSTSSRRSSMPRDSSDGAVNPSAHRPTSERLSTTASSS